MRMIHAVWIGALLVLFGCGEKKETVPAVQKTAGGNNTALAQDAAGQPRHIKVQHILIAFQDSIPGKSGISRSKEKAGELAKKLLEQARSGQDFTTLVTRYTDDSAPGHYRLANFNVPILRSQPGARTGQESKRKDMVKSFGDVAFSLEVGEVGLAEYDLDHCPYGWHIIKRLE